MSGSRLERLRWIARWKLAALLNRNRFRVYPLGNNRVWLNINESLMTWQCALGEYDAAKRSCLENILRPGMSFVDVGANMGYFSLLAADLVGPEG